LSCAPIHAQGSQVGNECGGENEYRIIGSPPHIEEVTGGEQKQIARFLRRKGKINAKNNGKEIKKFKGIKNHY
jgi:hypothetical protein